MNGTLFSRSVIAVTTFLPCIGGIRSVFDQARPSSPRFGARTPMLAASLLLVIGCGGGGGGGSVTSSTGSGGLGSAVIRIVWPTRNRQIPAAANSIVVSLLLGGTQTSSQTIPRPPAGTTTTQTTFTGLQYGTYTTSIQAFPQTDGSGVAQASGTGTMTVADGTAGTVTVDMASTVSSISISPASPNINKLATTTLTVSAVDANGNVVLLAAGGGAETLNWASDTTNVATITGTGPTATLTGVHAGSANITVSFKVNDSGATVSASTPVTINPINDGTGTVTIQ